MKKQHSTWLHFIMVTLGLTWLGSCGPAQTHTVVHSPHDLSGIYNGTHQIDFNISAPSPQRMTPDQRQGPVHVNDNQGSIQLSLRLYNDGRPCHLDGIHRGNGRVSINGGQRCWLRFHYNGTLVHTDMQIRNGEAVFTTGGLQITMDGPFVGEALISNQRSSVQGESRVHFSGTR